MDYIHSVDVYMDDPERFSRILRTSIDKLDKRIAGLQKKLKEQQLEEEAARKIERFRQDYSFKEYFPYLDDEPYVHYYDSLTFEVDSLRTYRLVPIETKDTLYDKLRMVVKSDTLEVEAVQDEVQDKEKPIAIEGKKIVPSLQAARPMNPDSLRRMMNFKHQK
jgi:hypothetical protein